MVRATSVIRLILVISGFFLAVPLQAQTFPNKPLRLFVGFPAGSSADIIGRVVADGLTKQLGQPVIVENRVGANGTLSALAVKTAPPDGYALFAGSIPSFSPVFVKNNPVHAPKELQPISSTAALDWFVVVRPNLGINSLRDLAAYAKANPGKLRFGQPPPTNMIFMAAIAKEMGFPFNPVADAVPYKGTPQLVQGFLANDIQTFMSVYTDAGPLVKAGTARVLAVLGRERSALLPAAPTATEQGVPLVQRSRQGIWTTLGTPADTVARLSHAVNDVVKQPAVAERITNLSMVPGASTPEELLRNSEEDLRFFTEYADRLGVKPE